APDVRGEQVVEGGDRGAPGQFARGAQPFDVLVDHRVDDVHERLVAGEQAVPPGEQIALEPALAHVLGEDLMTRPCRSRCSSTARVRSCQALPLASKTASR